MRPPTRKFFLNEKSVISLRGKLKSPFNVRSKFWKASSGLSMILFMKSEYYRKETNNRLIMCLALVRMGDEYTQSITHYFVKTNGTYRML